MGSGLLCPLYILWTPAPPPTETSADFYLANFVEYSMRTVARARQGLIDKDTIAGHRLFKI
jgi:hypothetical protein